MNVVLTILQPWFGFVKILSLRVYLCELNRLSVYVITSAIWEIIALSYVLKM